MSLHLDSAARQQFKSAEISAVKILADGTRIDLGRIAYWHRNPLKRAWFAFTQLFRRSPT